MAKGPKSGVSRTKIPKPKGSKQTFVLKKIGSAAGTPPKPKPKRKR